MDGREVDSEKCRADCKLKQTIGTCAEESEEAEVTEDLELLADFVADVGPGIRRAR